MEEDLRRAEAVVARMGMTIAEIQRLIDEREWRDVPTTPMPPELLADVRRR
jgi:hypothetical protein